jgi:hypothetical protein
VGTILTNDFPQFESVAGWSSSVRMSVQARHPGRQRSGTIRRRGSLRVLSRNLRRYLAGNGQLGAAMEFPGGRRVECDPSFTRAGLDKGAVGAEAQYRP